MGRKILLFLSAAHCHACSWLNGDLSAAKCFADNAEGKEQFTAFLHSHRDPVLLLADLIEEDFRHESVPHLRGRERAALIRRKLEQHYRNTPFRQALTLQRRKDGRRDDDMLFTALTNPALISPWLNIMLECNVALAGIYSVPHIIAPLVRDISSGHVLLLSWEKHAGLRQTYFDAGLLRFSRLTPMSASASLGATATTETARTQQYLKNLSLMPPEAALDVHFLCHASDWNELEACLNNGAVTHYARLDIQELGRRIGATTVYADSDATLLFLHLLATQPPRSHYAAAEHTHFLRSLHIRRGLSGVGAALATGAMLWAGANIMQGMTLGDENRSLRMQAGQLSQQSREITRSFPDTRVPAADMKAAVILSRNLGSLSTPPQEILGGLSRALDDFPRIHIARLSWQTGAGAEDVAAAVPAQVILLDGELAGFSGDYRDALNHLEHFRRALAQRGYLVAPQTLPLDVSPQGSIIADAMAGTKQPARFSLKISRRPAT